MSISLIGSYITQVHPNCYPCFIQPQNIILACLLLFFFGCCFYVVFFLLEFCLQSDANKWQFRQSLFKKNKPKQITIVFRTKKFNNIQNILLCSLLLSFCLINCKQKQNLRRFTGVSYFFPVIFSLEPPKKLIIKTNIHFFRDEQQTDWITDLLYSPSDTQAKKREEKTIMLSIYTDRYNQWQTQLN